MKGGKSRLQRVKVLASGKYKFVKNLKKRLSRTRKASPSRRRGGIKTMARRKRRRGGKSLTQQAFKWIRVGALVAPEVAEVMQYGLNRDSMRSIISHKTGYNIDTRTFDWGELAVGWMPYIASVLVTYSVPKIASILRRL
jgi:hypothetical protein